VGQELRALRDRIARKVAENGIVAVFKEYVPQVTLFDGETIKNSENRHLPGELKRGISGSLPLEKADSGSNPADCSLYRE